MSKEQAIEKARTAALKDGRTWVVVEQSGGKYDYCMKRPMMSGNIVARFDGGREIK
jgi:hypothetical protein